MRKRLLISSLSLACLGLSACTPPSPSTATTAEALTVKGELFYLQRIALSPNSTAKFSVYEVPPADASAKEVWQHKMDLGHSQVPIPFAFTVDKSQLALNQRYGLRAIIYDPQGNMRWTTDTAIAIDPQVDTAEVGAIKLVQVSASEKALSTPVFRAFGNEPGWNFTLQGDQADVVLDYGQTHHSITLAAPQSTFTSKHYQGTFNGSNFAIDLLHTPCVDNMSGEKFDHQVTLHINNQTFKGCGRYQ